MEFAIYERKHGPEQEKLGVSNHVKFRCVADATHNSTTQVIFRAQECLVPGLHSHFYVKRKGSGEMQELWLIQFVAPLGNESPPYTYIAEVLCKFRDVSEDWVED